MSGEGGVYKKFFDSSVSNLEKNIVKKLRDSNTMRSTVANPYYRTVVLQNVSRLAFAFKYGRYFVRDEILQQRTDNSSPLFGIDTIQRLVEIFPTNSLFKVLPARDVSFITPWYKLNTDTRIVFPDEKIKTFEEGKLVIPIQKSGDKLQVFFVCGGLDDNDNIPEWVVDKSVEDLGFQPGPQEFVEKKGIGHISVNKKDYDWTYVPKDQEIEDNDYLRVRSCYYKVLGHCRDINNVNFDCVRFTTKFEKNSNHSTYGIIKPPVLKGNIAWLDVSELELHRTVEVHLTKLDTDGFGNLNVRFQNACFNSLGFLVHDTAV